MQSAAPAVQLLQSDEVESLPETGDSETSSNPERRQLRNKLSELQEKKEKMEQLLGELQTLRDYRRQNVAGKSEIITVSALCADCGGTSRMILLLSPLPICRLNFILLSHMVLCCNCRFVNCIDW